MIERNPMEHRNPVLETSQYPLPSEAQILLVTPEMASDWLAHRTYDKNRRISKSVVNRYISDMVNGRWKTTRQGLIFDTHGDIIDGQHRLSAVANGNVTVAFWVYPNEARDTFDALDQGYKRQASQLLGVPNSTTVAAGARYLAALADQDPFDMPRFNKVSNPEIHATVQVWPELTRYSVAVAEVRIATWIIGAPHLAVLAQAARTEAGTPEKIEAWRQGLLTGDNLTSYDPRLQLRNRFIRQHRNLAGSKNRNLVYSLIAKAWNAWAEDKGVAVLRWTSAEPLTPVLGFDWAKYNNETEQQNRSEAA